MNETKTEWRDCADPDELAAAVAAGVEVLRMRGGGWVPSALTHRDDFAWFLTHGTRYQLPTAVQCECTAKRVPDVPPAVDLRERTLAQVATGSAAWSAVRRHLTQFEPITSAADMDALASEIADAVLAVLLTPPPAPPCDDDENDDIARLSPDQGGRIVDACCRMLGCEPADIDGDAAYEEILTEAVERCADLHGQDRWEDDCHGCGFRVGDHTTDGRCPPAPSPVPPWPGAVLSGLVDEDGVPTWLAQAGQVRGEQVRGWRDMAWYRPDGHSSDTWVEVRAPRAVPAALVTVTIPAETAHALLRYIEDGDDDTDYVIDRLADLLIAAMDGDQ